MFLQTTPESPLWMSVPVALAVLCSFALACGMPFAALGAVAALAFTARGALALAGLSWLVNQVIGFGFLQYPLDALTLAWGIALGLSALAAVVGARLAARCLPDMNELTRYATVFAAAWVVQQGAIFFRKPSTRRYHNCLCRICRLVHFLDKCAHLCPFAWGSAYWRSGGCGTVSSRSGCRIADRAS